MEGERVVWFTGLPCSGKTTLAKELKTYLLQQGKKCIVLDGDALRSTPICSELGFSKEDRRTNLLRAAHICKMLAKSDVIVLASFVSPYESIRDEIGSIIAPYKFDIVHVNTPVEYCEKRDVKGMYKMAREGKIKDFTGVSDPFEDPVAPTVRIDTSHCSVEAALNKVRSAVGL